MATTLELMTELVEIMQIRDAAIERFDETDDPDDLRVYEAAEHRLDQWFEHDAPAKVAALMALRDKRKVDAKWRKDEAGRWRAAAKRSEKSALWLHDSALALLRRAEAATGQESLALPGGRTAAVRVRRGQPVEVTDADALPDEFCRIKRDPDKAAIKAAIQAGQVVPGAELVETTRDYVSIKG